MKTEFDIICNKVIAEVQADEFNERIIHIARCFEYDKFIGVDNRSIKSGDRLYWNNYFDYLMQMSLPDLEDWEIKMFKITKDYGESLNRYPAKE